MVLGLLILKCKFTENFFIFLIDVCFSQQEVIDKYTAVVKMIDSGDKLKLDQTHLETVIPAPGIAVLFFFSLAVTAKLTFSVLFIFQFIHLKVP